MKNYINRIIVLGIFIGAWFAMSCTEDLVCIYDDNGAGGGNVVPETNACSEIDNDPLYTILQLTDGTAAYPFDVDKFVESVETQLEGNVKGWQLAVGYDNKVIRTKSGGLRTGAADCPAELEMSACTKMNIGSQTKAVVCTAILMLLDEAGKDPFVEKIVDYIPKDWDVKPGVEDLTIAHFLGHRNGFADLSGGTREDIKVWFETGITGTVGTWDYQNENYQLMRIIFPFVYGNAKGIVYDSLSVDTDEECSDIEVAYIENSIFKPLGNFEDIILHDEDGSKVNYFDNIFDDEGLDFSEYRTIGAGTLVVSAKNMVKFYIELFNGNQNVISPNVIDYMRRDNWEIGLNRRDFTVPPMNQEYFGHGGTLSGYLSVTINLPGNLTVSLAVNSCFLDNGLVTSSNICSSWGPNEVVLKAYSDAF